MSGATTEPSQAGTSSRRILGRNLAAARVLRSSWPCLFERKLNWPSNFRQGHTSLNSRNRLKRRFRSISLRLLFMSFSSSGPHSIEYSTTSPTTSAAGTPASLTGQKRSVIN